MPLYSIVVPTYNGEQHIGECLDSILGQSVRDFEVIVVDDCSNDGTASLVREIAAVEPRLRLMERSENGGTLRTRRDGVLASTGDYVLLVDQDDALADGALENVSAFLGEKGVDILHFGVRVVSENPAALDAASGMEGFLTPPGRELAGEEILRAQFAESGGFDWHVHHKAFRGGLARAAWEALENVPLTLSDDLYASFVLCSLATTYYAAPGSPWYEYHLGRGETFGSALSRDGLRRTAQRDHEAFRLVTRFAESGRVTRGDWDSRLADVRDHLVEHVMNELHDNLPISEQADAIDDVLGIWPSDAVAGELWRFVRDRAYELFDARDYPSPDDQLHRLVADARRADVLVGEEHSERYLAMREAATRHLNDLETLLPPGQQGAKSVGILGRLLRRIGLG